MKALPNTKLDDDAVIGATLLKVIGELKENPVVGKLAVRLLYCIFGLGTDAGSDACTFAYKLPPTRI